jgi:hypothetical protein
MTPCGDTNLPRIPALPCALEEMSVILAWMIVWCACLLILEVLDSIDDL